MNSNSQAKTTRETIATIATNLKRKYNHVSIEVKHNVIIISGNLATVVESAEFWTALNAMECKSIEFANDHNIYPYPINLLYEYCEGVELSQLQSRLIQSKKGSRITYNLTKITNLEGRHPYI